MQRVDGWLGWAGLGWWGGGGAGCQGEWLVGAVWCSWCGCNSSTPCMHPFPAQPAHNPALPRPQASSRAPALALPPHLLACYKPHLGPLP